MPVAPLPGRRRTEFTTFIQSLAGSRESTTSIVNTGDLVTGGDAQGFIRAIGISASGAETRNRTYDFTVENQADMTFSTGTSQGISLFATSGDTVTASIANSGNFDVTAAVAGSTTIAASEGIRATFGARIRPRPPPAAARAPSTTAAKSPWARAARSLPRPPPPITIANSGALSITADGATVVSLTSSTAGSGTPDQPRLHHQRRYRGDGRRCGRHAGERYRQRRHHYCRWRDRLLGTGPASAGLRFANTGGALDVSGSLLTTGGTALVATGGNVLAVNVTGTGVIGTLDGTAINSASANTITLAA